MTPLADVEDATAVAGLVTSQRWSSWTGDPFEPTAGYVVLVLHRPAA